MEETDVGSEILEIPVGASCYIKKKNKNKEKQQPELSVVTECL